MKMRTDQLIAALAQAGAPKAPFDFGAAVALLVMLSILITAALLGLRPEVMHFAITWPVMQKTLLLSEATILSFLWLGEAATPLPQRKPAYWLWLFAAVWMGLIALEWASVPAHEILRQFLLPNFPVCLIAVSACGTCGIVALTLLMRQFAPIRPTKAASLIGLSAATAGALGYSLHCPLDSPTFILVAYGIPVGLLSIISRLVLPKFLRW